MRMAELLLEAGLPKGVFNLVTAGRAEAELLLTHPRVRGVSFVGSTAVGKHVYSVAAAHGKRVQCLTEAKNHALVLRDAPIRATAQRVINSAFGCAGERCMALPVIAVEEPIADELVATLCELAKQLKLGPAWEESTELGPALPPVSTRPSCSTDREISRRGRQAGPGWPRRLRSRLRGRLLSSGRPSSTCDPDACGWEEVSGPS